MRTAPMRELSDLMRGFGWQIIGVSEKMGTIVYVNHHGEQLVCLLMEAKEDLSATVSEEPSTLRITVTAEGGEVSVME